MWSKMAHASISLSTPVSLLTLSLVILTTSLSLPTPWPIQFHSILFMNRSGALQHVDLWYDYPNGRNFNIIQRQLGKLTYDLEWNNGTSYYYTLDENKECRVKLFEVGILRPDWLEGADYLGQEYKDGFLCNVWEKVEFIWYYEDVVTKRPVSWKFFSGAVAHVMTFEVGKVLEDPQWQAPVYCFEGTNKKNESLINYVTNLPSGIADTHSAFMRGIASS